MINNHEPATIRTMQECNHSVLLQIGFSALIATGSFGYTYLLFAPQQGIEKKKPCEFYRPQLGMNTRLRTISLSSQSPSTIIITWEHGKSPHTGSIFLHSWRCGGMDGDWGWRKIGYVLLWRGHTSKPVDMTCKGKAQVHFKTGSQPISPQRNPWNNVEVSGNLDW